LNILQLATTISLMVSIYAALMLWQARPDPKMNSILTAYAKVPPPSEKIMFFFNRAKVQTLLHNAGVTSTTPERFILFKFLLAGAMAWNLRNSNLMVVIVPALFFLPDFYLAKQKKARQIKLLVQMPGCLDIISALIAAGMDVGQAIAQVPAVLKEPLRSEMLRAGAEFNLTRDLHRALGNVANRTGMLEFEHLMMALSQAEASGRVRGVLKKQSDLLRKRLHFSNVQGTSSKGLLLTMSMAVLFLNAVLLLGGPIFFNVITNLETFFG
jgi:Flp pilus assembly protein TadB